MRMHRAVVLEPESAGNIGFIARLVENFAINELFIVNPQCEIGDTAKERAVHAQDTLRDARIVDDFNTAIKGLDTVVGTTGIDVSDENLVRHAVTPRQMTEELTDDVDIGIVLGREGTGMTNDELDTCDFVVRIPTDPSYEVMNLSHAAAVLFYELYTDAGSTNEFDGTPSSRTQREVLENLFKDAAETLSWEQHREEKAVRAFRNVIGRSYMTDRECSLLLGLFRELRDKAQSGQETK